MQFGQDDKYTKIIDILSVIHDEWVKNNANKFMARPKDYQFVDLRLLSYEEVESDLIFLKPILEGCNIEIDNNSLKEKFLEIQKQYIQEQGIFSHSDLVQRLMEGSDFYTPLSELKTNKGKSDGEEHEINTLLQEKDIAENMASQIEEQICYQRTDLHTHLNAILPEKKLIELAENCNIDISEIKHPLDMTENGIFSEMLEVYRERNDIIIKKIIQNGYGTEFLRKIALDYKEHGISYTEITANSEILKEIVDGNIDIDEIEKETGVKLRFLLQIHRHDNGEKNKKEFTTDTIQSLIANSKFIKGIDICGQESDGFELKNQELFLECLADYADLNQDFIIRIHSGETEKDTNGIKEALEIIKSHCDSLGEKYPQIRIGHAIHGINEESIKLMKELGASIELNLASNLRLINLNQSQLLKDANLVKTIQLCEKYDIPIYLGTDGYGLYSSTPEKQMELAKETEIDLLKIIQNEEKYLEDEKLRENNDKTKRTKITKKAPEKKKIKKRLEKLNISEISDKKDIFKDKIPIIIAGGSLKTRGNIDFEEYKEIAIAFQTLVDIVDPRKVFFVTGGTNCGPERFLHEAVNRKNKTLESNKSKYIQCLGAIPSCVGKDDENARFDFKKIQENTITHGLVVDAFKSWGQFPLKLLQIANNKLISIKENGIGIFVGGGGVVRDEIKLAIDGDRTEKIRTNTSMVI